MFHQSAGEGPRIAILITDIRCHATRVRSDLQGSCYPAAKLTVIAFAHKPAVYGSRSQAGMIEGFARYSEALRLGA